MEAIIDKLCNSLKGEVLIIGIILNCNGTYIDYDKMKNIDICVISKEASSQTAKFSENGVNVNLEWRTDIDFIKQVRSKDDSMKSNGHILYDKTGLIHQYMQ